MDDVVILYNFLEIKQRVLTGFNSCINNIQTILWFMNETQSSKDILLAKLVKQKMYNKKTNRCTDHITLHLSVVLTISCYERPQCFLFVLDKSPIAKEIYDSGVRWIRGSLIKVVSWDADKVKNKYAKYLVMTTSTSCAVIPQSHRMHEQNTSFVKYN